MMAVVTAPVLRCHAVCKCYVDWLLCLDSLDHVLCHQTVFLSFSAAPILRIIYNHCDDHAISLNDYLYRSAENDNVLCNAAKYSSFEVRWGILR